MRPGPILQRLAPAILLAASLIAPAAAELWLPAVFSDHMVLQRHQPLPIWGRATPGAAVTVRLDDQILRLTAGADGAWRGAMAARAAGGPHTLTVTGADDTLRRTDVWIGEVWLASGQSNMEWPVRRSDGAAAEIVGPHPPGLRLFLVPRATASTPRTDVDARWVRPDSSQVAGFSAVAWHFGRRLHETLGVPVGLVQAAWGGTRIEPWTPLPALRELAGDLPAAQRAALEAGLARSATLDDDEAYRARQASEARLRAAEADTATTPARARPGFDDGAWQSMDLPAQWETAGLPGFDGLVWYRRTIDVPAAWAGRDLLLSLGPVDEIDVTWFDGEAVGATGGFATRSSEYWDMPRRYRVPGRLVRPGPRVVVLRVIDTAFAGGLWGQPADSLYLAPADAPRERLSLAGAWRYEPGTRLAPAPPSGQQVPGALYHAMIHPLVPYALRGAIWYQGESNRADGAAYADKMVALIQAWRDAWGQPLAFYFAQLAPFRYDGDPAALPRIWEAQAEVTDRVARTGMAVLTDVGDLEDIHPTDKATVGRRLAGWALARTYGRQVPYAGPRFLGLEVEGTAARVRFAYAQGLRTRDGAPPDGFEVAGADTLFVGARAVIDGTTVRVSSPQVSRPVFVRFAWHQEAEPNLVNGAGLPAAPFRSHRRAAGD